MSRVPDRPHQRRAAPERFPQSQKCTILQRSAAASFPKPQANIHCQALKPSSGCAAVSVPWQRQRPNAGARQDVRMCSRASTTTVSATTAATVALAWSRDFGHGDSQSGASLILSPDVHGHVDGLAQMPSTIGLLAAFVKNPEQTWLRGRWLDAFIVRRVKAVDLGNEGKPSVLNGAEA